MKSQLHAPKAEHPPLRRHTRTLFRVIAALAAALGFSAKPTSGDAAQDAADGAMRLDQKATFEPATSAPVRALLKGSWSAPPELGKSTAKSDKFAGAFGDLGFLSHIDSGFHDFVDHP